MSTPLICFEGPSGIGKTTLCSQLSKEYTIIPEVNLLFQRPKQSEDTWYLQKQVERFSISAKSHQTSILDGDIFQPIWYNWACNYPEEFLSLHRTMDFYRNSIVNGDIRFPDLYIRFIAPIKVLRERKERDKTRKRRNFEKHIKIIEPMNQYFEFLQNHTPLEVNYVEYKNVQHAKKEVQRLISGSISDRYKDDLEILGIIEDWIKTKEPHTDISVHGPIK